MNTPIQTLELRTPPQRHGEHLSQFLIAVFGIATLWCLTHQMLVGSLIGLIVQPLWLWSTYKNRQWGMLILSIIYLGIYGEGTWRWFNTS